MISSTIVTPNRSDYQAAQPHLAISAHDDYIRRIAYLPDGRRVVTGSGDGTIRVWNVESGEEERPPMEHGNDLCSFAVTRNGTKIISSEWEGNVVKVWNIESHKLVEQWTCPDMHPEVTIFPDDRLVAVGNRAISIYNLQGQQISRSIPVGNAVHSMTISPDGNKLACATDDDIRVYNIETGRLIYSPLTGHTHSVWCVQWSRDGNRLFSSSGDKSIRCWDSNTGEQIGRPWTGHTDTVESLSLSPNGSTLASASYDETVCLWDTRRSSCLIRKFEQHSDDVMAVSFSPSGEFVASGGSNGKVCLWHVPDFEERQPAPNPPNLSGIACAFIPAGQSNISHVLPVAEPYGEHRTSDFGANSSPPLDLTPYIVKSNDYYIAGGCFGDIYKCLYNDGSLKKVAVKVFRFTFTVDGDPSNSYKKMLRRELGIWRRLDHINIVPFLGIVHGFGVHGSMSLVSLWMDNESLHKFLLKHDKGLSVTHRLQLLLDIAKGLHYLHSIPIVHGDLSSNNVLLDASYTACLTDFGYASLVGDIPEALTYLHWSTAPLGTLRWMAPEQIESDSDEPHTRTTESDVYSFGCIVLQVLSGKVPWSEIRADTQVVLRLSKGEKPNRPKSRAIDDSHWKLIQSCWTAVKKRPAAKDIISTIREFLSCLPQSRPLRDLLASPSQLTKVDSSIINSLSSLGVKD